MSPLKKIVMRISFPIALFLLFSTIYLFWGNIVLSLGLFYLGKIALILNYIVGILIWLTLAWSVIRIIDLLFWELIIELKIKKQVPTLMKQLSHIVILFIAVLGIIGVIFDQSVTGLLTASGVVGLIIGFSMKNLLSDIFNGIALNLDAPFKLGDYIFLHAPAINDSGEVLEITWRTTRLRNAKMQSIVISNHQLSTIPITNLSRNKKNKDFVEITLDNEYPFDRIETILTAATLSVEGVSNEEDINISIANISNLGIVYRVSYACDRNVKGDVVSNITQQLQLAGITSSIPKIEVKTLEQDNDVTRRSILNPRRFITNIALFKDLTPEELSLLLEQSQVFTVDKEEILVTEGESGDSMYLLAEGLLEATKQNIKSNQPELRVGFIRSGEYFGEMSLLTGSPRTATIKAKTHGTVICIPKSAIQSLFESHPSLIDAFSQIIADRELASKRALETFELPIAEEKSSLLQQVTDNIKAFFGFGGKI